MEIEEVTASINQSGPSIKTIFDVKVNGNSIFSTEKLEIDPNTVRPSGLPAPIINNIIAKDAQVTIDILQAATGTAGAKIYIIGKRKLVIP